MSPSLPPFDDAVTRLSSLDEDRVAAFDETRGCTPFSHPHPRDTPGPLPVLGVSLPIDGHAAEGPSGPDDLQVAGLLGHGGMGDVWLARQQSLGREVAIKTTRPEGDARAERALIAEARVTGALEHPSIVPVHALGRASTGQAVLVMKRVEGVSWRTLLREPDHPHWPTLGPDEPLVVHVQILMQICNALELAHRRGVVHRDIKPANVMVGSFGEVYLLDWGLAIAIGRDGLEPGRLEGTPAYMAPEMIAGLPLDARTDVYLLGATLHEVLTGVPPHVGTSLTELLALAYEEQPRDYGEAPPELADLCRDAMRREPSARPSSARVFRDRLTAFLTHRSSTAILRRGRALLDALANLEAASPLDRAHRRSRLDECATTLRLALAEWPDNPAARSALEEWRRLAFTLELEDGQLAAAKHLLDQMRDPPADLRAKLAELDARMTGEQQAAELGRRTAFNVDAGIGARERWLLGVGVLTTIALTAVLAIMRAPESAHDPGEPLVLMVGPAMAFVLIVTLLRRRLRTTNAFTRQTLAVFGWIFVANVAHRLVAWASNQPPSQTYTGDLLMLTGACGVAALTLTRWFLAGAVAALAGALVAAANPALAQQTFRVVSLFVATIAVAAWSRDARRRAHQTSSADRHN